MTEQTPAPIGYVLTSSGHNEIRTRIVEASELPVWVEVGGSTLMVNADSAEWLAAQLVDHAATVRALDAQIGAVS